MEREDATAVREPRKAAGEKEAAKRRPKPPDLKGNLSWVMATGGTAP